MIKSFIEEGEFLPDGMFFEGRSYSGAGVCCECVLRLVQAALHI